MPPELATADVTKVVIMMVAGDTVMEIRETKYSRNIRK